MNIANRCISTAARLRAEKLLKELTLEEKVRQLGCTTLLSSDKIPEEKDLSGGLGAIALLDICEEPEALALRLRELQQYVMEHSPHHIPALFHCEALGGPVVPNTVLYPNSIGLGATFDTALVHDMADTIRKRPAAVAAFVKASMEGWKSYLQDPTPGNSLIGKANPQMGAELIAFGIAQMKQYQLVTGGDAKTGGIGIITEPRLKKTWDMLVKNKLIDASKVPFEQTYTLEMVKDAGVMP